MEGTGRPAKQANASTQDRLSGVLAVVQTLQLNTAAEPPPPYACTA
jgi:hypothetical protein